MNGLQLNMSESTNIVTLTSWTLKQKATDKELALLMNAIQLSCKFIARAVRKAGAPLFS